MPRPVPAGVEVDVLAAIDAGESYWSIGERHGIHKATVGMIADRNGRSRRQACPACVHPLRADIDAALVDGSESIRAIADRFGVSRAGLSNHRQRELGLAPRDRDNGLRCSVCEHVDAEAINLALLAGRLPSAVVGDRPPELTVAVVEQHRLKCLGMRMGVSGGRCVACDHPSAEMMDAALRSGVTVTKVASTYGASLASLYVHRRDHLDSPEWESKRAGRAVARLGAVRRYVEDGPLPKGPRAQPPAPDVAAFVERTCADSGVPVEITDPDVLDQLGRVLS